MSIILAVLAMSSPYQDQEGSALISKMIQKYHSASKISGSFSSETTIPGSKIVIQNKVQIQRPQMLYVSQSVQNNKQNFTVTSDGKVFSYEKPFDGPNTDRINGARLIENLDASTTLADIIRASAHSLAERSAILDLLISDISDLKFLREQWASVESCKLIDLNGEQVYRIVGRWRLDAKSPVSANYGMFITSSGDLRKYVIDGEFVMDEAFGEKSDKVRITREFQVKVDVDGEINTALFAVPK